jgi:hypothetical protein
MLCKICGFHGDDYEECHLLGCGAVWLLEENTFWKASSVMVERINGLGTTLAVTSNFTIPLYVNMFVVRMLLEHIQNSNDLCGNTNRANKACQIRHRSDIMTYITTSVIHGYLPNQP